MYTMQVLSGTDEWLLTSFLHFLKLVGTQCLWKTVIQGSGAGLHGTTVPPSGQQDNYRLMDRQSSMNPLHFLLSDT